MQFEDHLLKSVVLMCINLRLLEFASVQRKQSYWNGEDAVSSQMKLIIY